MTRKRLWEAGAAAALLLVLAACAGVFLYLRRVNEAFAAALAKGDDERAFALLRKGAGVRAGALPGTDQQALFLAVRSGNPAFVELVLDRGADVNTRRSDGHTILMAAAMGRRPEQAKIVRLLLDRGAEIEAADATGLTALHYAAGGDKVEPARTLLLAGANVDCRDRTGRTPLMHAAKMGDAESVRLLLIHGANPALRNRAGNTALILARRTPFRRRAVVQLLTQAGTR